MITITPDIQPFNESENHQLSVWLSMAGEKLAEAHVKGKLATLFVCAAQELAEARNDQPGLIASAKDLHETALRYKNFLEVLLELQQQEQFSRVRINYE